MQRCPCPCIRSDGVNGEEVICEMHLRRGRPLNRPSRRRSNPNEFEYVNERSIAPCEKFRKSISYIGGVHNGCTEGYC